MTFSGIHVNYSFSEKLLEADFKYQKETDYQEYKNRYAWRIRKQFGDGYVKKGLELVKERQGE